MEVLIALVAFVVYGALLAASLNACLGILARMTRWRWLLATGAWWWIDRREYQATAATVLAVAVGVNLTLGFLGAALCGFPLAVYWAAAAIHTPRSEP